VSTRARRVARDATNYIPVRVWWLHTGACYVRSAVEGTARGLAGGKRPDSGPLGPNVIGQYPGRVLDLHGEAGQGSFFLIRPRSGGIVLRDRHD
jgi:hypothetical protein